MANRYAAGPAACDVPTELPSCAPPPLLGPPVNATGCRFSSGDGLRGLFTDIGRDYGNFYSCRGLFWIGTSLGVGAVLANTSLDQDFQDWYQNDVRSSGTDDVAGVAYHFGSGQYVIPAMAAAWLVGEWCCDNPVRRGRGPMGRAEPAGRARRRAARARSCNTRSARRGRAKAAARTGGRSTTTTPSAATPSSARSRSLLPRRCRTRSVFKVTMITFSVLPAWSRVNDDRHYLSQVLLGYSFACLSVWAVDATEQGKRPIMIVPMAVGNGAGDRGELRVLNFRLQISDCRFGVRRFIAARG